MKESLLLVARQLTEELLQKPLESAEALKGEIKKREEVQEEIDCLEELLGAIEEVVEELKRDQESLVSEAMSLREELKQKVKSLGDAKMQDKYNEFAGGVLTVIRIKLPDELARYGGYESVRALKGEIKQLKSTLNNSRKE